MRANAALDWIEQRDGPLKPDGYARVEATVAEVRAWGQAMSDDERISEIRARLEKATPGPWQTWPEGTEESVESVSLGRFVCHLNSNVRQFREDAALIANAPADIAYLLARVDALTQERDYLSSCFDELMKAGKSQRDRADKAESERDALRARAERAEAALRTNAIPQPDGALCWCNNYRVGTCDAGCLDARAALVAAGEGEG